MQETMSLGFVFADAPLLAETGSKGVYDDSNVVICVAPEIDSPVVWSGILNLAARLAFEVVGCDLPLVARHGETPGKPYSLVIDYQGGKRGVPSGFLTVARPDRTTAVLTSDSEHCLRDCLDAMAVNALAPPERALEPGDTFQGIYGQEKKLTGCTLNGERFSQGLPAGQHRASGSALHTPCPEVGPVDLLRLDRLYDTGTPGESILPFSWTIASEHLSSDTGIALSEALLACVMEANQISLPLVRVGGAIPADGITVVINETGPESKTMPEHGLSVMKEPSGRIIRVTGSSTAFQQNVAPWFAMGLCRGGGRFPQAESLRASVTDVLTVLNGVAPAGRHAVAPATSLDASPAPGTPICHDIRWPGELPEILGTVSDVVPGQGDVLCEVYVSKPPEVRRRLQQTVEEILSSRGYSPRVRVFNAFKPGLSRLLEYVLPRIKTMDAASVKISCRLFAGVDGALELRHRWLHELYPCPEIMARDLGLSPDQVTLTVDDGQTETYRVVVRDADDQPVFSDAFSPFFRTMPYSAHMPGTGTVSPTCSGVRIARGTQILLNQAIDTDRDRFWNFFQQQAVPDILSAMDARLSSGPLGGQTAFFDTIAVDVCMDETDTGLGFMGEQISPMEALQEDIYFFLLSMAQQFSQDHDLPDSIRLGRILPRVKALTEDGIPSARVEAIPLHPAPPAVHPGTGGAGYDQLTVWNQCRQFHFRVQPPVPGETDDQESRLALAASLGFSYRTADDGFILAISVNSQGAGKGKVFQDDIDIPEDRVLPAADVVGLLSRLGRHPDIRVWEIARSTLGLPIYAVEAFRCSRDFISVPRLRRARPTVLINARHHANEVSSTTAVLQFIRHLCTQGSDTLATVNVVLIPMENVDGIATFESLYVDGKNDMLHAARYNAVGAEFYHEYHKAVPVFPEAMAKKRLWERWLPELMADLHGVPGHEWCQPFAGYTPMGFEEFWLPRSFVWVHLPFMEEENHPLHADILELAAAMDRAIAREPDIMAADRAVTQLYQRYARQFEPEIFPPADRIGLTALPLLGRARDFNYAVRHPGITRAEVVVEVPDEVAHGKDLALCIKTHYVMQKTLVEQSGVKCPETVSVSVPGTGRTTFIFKES